MSCLKAVHQHEAPLVFVVDDDDVFRTLLARMLSSQGYDVAVYDSAESFLAGLGSQYPACILLDVVLPEMSGLDLQRRLLDLRMCTPVILMSNHATVPMAVEAMQIGAFDVLEKASVIASLFTRVNSAVEHFERVREVEREQSEVSELYKKLTQRELEVLELIVTGLPARAIGQMLQISSRTVDVHRSHIITKMKATSVTDLVRRVAGLCPARKGVHWQRQEGGCVTSSSSVEGSGA